ncbi:MAG: helix-turn-helix transcriptional regulator [Sphingomicrobium sp.]|nr:hypothetical protein [Sphingomonadales bacterium]
MAATENSQLYRDLMRLKPEDVTPNGWAVKAGVSRTVWTDMRRHGNPSRRTLDKLLSVAGSSLAEFEALRIGEVPRPAAGAAVQRGLRDVRAAQWGSAALPPLPLLSTAMAGEWDDPARQIELTELGRSEILDHLPRPPSLAGDREAYAMTIVGDSMWPRFRPSRRVIVSPRSPVAIGDDVVVQLVGSGEDGERPTVSVLIKEYVRRTAAFVELRQFNPDLRFRVPADAIAAIHKIVGEHF